VADCDVDAADLHLILKPDVKKTAPFYGLDVAVVDDRRCISCGKCYESCRFGAITPEIVIVPTSCEGCGVCAYVCPVDAITMQKRESGFAYVSETRFGPMAHAVLKTAEEASGKLVTVVRNNAKRLAETGDRDLVIIDGPPGIGCPVIAAIADVDLVVAVTEPTLSAIHDLDRILGVARHFTIPAVVCVNKWDINADNTEKIETYCTDNGVEVVGKLPYDLVVTEAMIAEKSVVEFSGGQVSRGVREMWDKIVRRLQT
jgi:MinD superfamily P-loop ATPase